MSRARELAKVGGKNQQVIAGLSSHVGVSTFLNNVHMFANLDVGGNVVVTGTTTFNGGTLTLGDANTDNIVFGGEVDSHIIPDDDGTFDLGSSTKEWKDLYIDGTAHVDTLDVDENAGIIGNLTLTGNADFNGDLDVDGTTNLDVVDIDGAVDMASNLVIAGNIDANGDLDVDGTTNLDVVDIDGAVDMASNLVIAGNIDANGNLDVDGTTDLDATNVVGTLTVTGDIAADNVTVNGNTVSTSSGNLTLDSNGGTVAVSDNITVSGNGSVTGTLDVDGATTLDGLTVAEGATFSSTLGVSGTTTLSGAFVANGNVDLGNATSDTITATGRFDSDIVPSTDNARDLGASGLEFKDLYLDGTAHVDTLDVDENAAIIGTLDVNSSKLTVGVGNTDVIVRGDMRVTGIMSVGNGTVTIDETTVKTGTSNLHNVGIEIAGINVLGADTPIGENATIFNNGNATFAGEVTAASLDISGNIDIDGTTNLDVVDIDGAVDMASSLTIAGALDANGGASLDNVQVGVTNDNEIDTSSGNLVIDSAGGTTTIDDNLTVSGNLTVNGTTTTINSTTVAIDDKNFQVATGAADDAAADGAGLTVDSGDGDKTFNFEATGDNWGASENLNLASGKAYKINNASILNATTLGSSVVASSLTSVGTIATGVWNGTAITNANLANSTVSYGGISLSLGGTDATPAFDLSDATSYPTSSLVGTITNAQLAGSIANSKLAGSITNAKLSNSTVSYGGISLSLGGTDATPAFDLSDATNYPTSSLSGTITNAQLAGSIAASKLAGSIGNAKLSNSSVSYGGVSLSLGGSDGTPAFDLSDATNYPTSSLSGTITNAQLAGSIEGTKLENSGVTAATYGSSTAIPILTVDAQGLVTSASTTAVDSTTIENGSASVAVASNGPITSTGNHDFTAGIDVTGNITVSGTVDGRDVATDGTKLDGIESSATADQTAAEIRALVESASDSNVFTDADHSKLNGIEASATADQTASEILTLIKTVDGSGSGLDADTLDGISVGSLLRSDTSDTFTGTLTVSGNILPNANGTRDLGASGTRWANVYTSDIDLNNQAKGGNTIDQSWGSYLIEEGEHDLFLKNRRSGKTYKFMLQEV